MEKKGLQQTEGRILFNSDISRIISVSPLYKLKHKQILDAEGLRKEEQCHENTDQQRGKSNCVYIYF